MDPSDAGSTVIHVDDIGLTEALSVQQHQILWCRTPRRKALRLVESLPMRVTAMLLMLVDLVVVILDLANPSSVYDAIALTIVSLFVVEIAFRMFGLGPRKFFSNWVMIFDFVVVVLTFIVTIVFVSLTNLEGTAKIGKLVVLARLIRLPRLIVLLRVFLTERKQLSQAARRVVSQNKKRFQDDGFDLDLCYITDDIIAMSFPSSNLMAAYRNPIKEVARFLDLKHPGSYKVYNLCSERTYDTSHFHDRVERYFIDDHNVPRLSDLVRFASSARSWLAASSSNVIVVHCKGGKGRTGTMICTRMVDAGIYESAKECLDFFGLKRTDYLQGIKFQGVETPSQNRYVGFFEIVKKQFDYKVPRDVKMRVKQIVIHGISSIGNGDGSDFRFEIFQGGQLAADVDVGQMRNCESLVNRDTDAVTVTIRNPPIVVNDVKFRFYSSNKSVPVGYERCAFFFWLYTYFIEDCRVKLDRTQLDNPHKPKTWRVWHEDFAVELLFEKVIDA